MALRILIRSIAHAALLASTAAYAQFNSCTLVNSALTTGSDPINYTRMALRQDGRPVLVYTNNVHNSSSIFFYDCANPTCSAGHWVYLDTSSNYYGASGIIMRSDGRPAMTSSWFGGVRFYNCADANCSVVTTSDIRINASAIFGDMPIALQSNGNPVFLYIDGGPMFSSRPNDLIVHFCADVDCIATGTEQILATPAALSGFSGLSLAVGSDGHVAATYLASEGASNLNTYNIARCSDLACTAVTNTLISAPVSNSSAYRTAVAIRSNQRPLALDSQSNNTALLDCTSSPCTSINNRLLPASAAGQPIGLGLLPGDLAAFAVFSSGKVGAFACTDSVCSAGVLAQANSAATSILDADFAVDANTHPAITYIDADTGGLAVAGCNSNVVFIDGFD
jgi:hypothetical protein